MAQGKKYVDAAKKYDKTELHEPDKAFELVKSLATRNFDETVEVAFKLGCRSPQGRPDAAQHGVAAGGHRQGRAGRGVRDR